MNRRELLMTIAALSAGPVACSQREGASDAVSEKRKLENIGIQLYTVRDHMAADVPGTLEQLATIGYREVEFAGYYDHTPAEIRGFLDNTGLRSPSTHIGPQQMRETPEKIIEAALAVGHEYVVLAWLPPEDRVTLDQYRQHAEQASTFGEQCQAAGLQFAWHNHDFEFQEIDGVRPMDLLLTETDPSIMQMELDLYWITKAGADPFAFFDAYPGRTPLCHVKDMDSEGAFADVGDGVIDFANIFGAIDKAGLKHFYVERDNAVETDSMASATNGFAGASAIRF